MGLHKGQTNNPKGRPKGKPNKVTMTMKDSIKAILQDEIKRLPGILTRLEPKERCDTVIKLLPYVVPKQQEIDVHTEVNELLSNIDNLTDEQLAKLEEIIKNAKQ